MKNKSILGYVFLGALALTACSKDDGPELVPVTPPTPVTPPDPTPVPTPDPDPDPIAYEAPTYEDYYINSNMGDWTRRSKWNLANVHDPSVMLAEDGYYYMYQTDASYGNVHANHGHFFCRRSKNLIDWEFLGATMPKIPSWLKDKVNELRKSMGLGETTINFADNNMDIGYWAPCVRMVKPGLYRMYYSINMPTVGASGDKMSASTVNHNLMGMMETSDPSKVDSWEDKGYVICQYSDQNKSYSGKSIWGGYFKYNVIDPSYIITKDNEHWLIYGSWHSGFAAVQLNPETGKPINELGDPWGANESNYGKRVFTRVTGDRWQGTEAPEVVYRDGYYYMFIAYGQLAYAYHTRVVRSTNINGPYKDITGQDFTNGTKSGEAYPIVTHPYKFGNDHGWVGISHCAVFDDGKGNYYYASQQRFPANYNNNQFSNALMLGGVRSIIWTESGWPLVLPERYAAVPQTEIKEADLVGKWQHINIGGCTTIWDDQCKMSTSVDIELTADHKVTSDSKWSANATWSFDATKNVLTIGTMKLYLKRELDWEANPRVPTIVYAGLSTDYKTTLWGKKVK